MVTQHTKSSKSILRSEIKIQSLVLQDKADKDQQVLNCLISSQFNPLTSRAVIFVSSRRMTEDLAERINAEKILGVQAACFHAGLPSNERSSIYEQFSQENNISVLCATKAFGMGMDIDNIHLIIHYGPSYSLEDYLQEIGRAARKKDSLHAAGLSHAKALLLYESDDFRRKRDFLKKESLSKMDLCNIFDALQTEAKEQQIFYTGDEPVLIEMNQIGFTVDKNENQIRLALYWLERLNRIQLGCYTISNIRIEIDRDLALSVRPSLSEQEGRMLDFIAKIRTIKDKREVSINVNTLKKETGIFNNDELFICLSKIIKTKAISYLRHLHTPLNERRLDESQAGIKTNKWLILETVFVTIEDLIIKYFSLQDSINITRDELVERFKHVAQDEIKAENYPWLDIQDREERAKKDKSNYKSKISVILRFLRTFNIISFQQSIQEGKINYKITLARQEFAYWYSALPNLVRGTLAYIVNNSTLKESNSDYTIDAQDLLLHIQAIGQKNQLKIVGPSHIQAILRFLRDLDYLKYADTYIARAIEVKIQRIDPIDIYKKDGDDSKVLFQFEEQQEMRQMRLDALQAFAYLSQHNIDSAILEDYIDKYFSVRTKDELIGLLENFSQDKSINEILSQIREDALEELLQGNPIKEGKPGLSLEQRAVYDAPLDKNILVIAGPGAGKTHTLLVRLIRLVHKERIPPEKILVLAFTRAVVSELRCRLRIVLRSLGYHRLAEGIEIRTFHSFVRKSLRSHNLISKDINISDKNYFEEFENKLRTNIALKHTLYNQYQYIFVDEFQDVHGTLYRLLDHLNSKQAHFLVVGDDDQSIYDYEKSDTEKSTSYYFNEYIKKFNADKYPLTQNYRSTENIVKFSQDIICQLPDRQKESYGLTAYRTTAGIVETIPVDDTQANIVEQVKMAKEYLNSIAMRRSNHKTIAILARTNADVYRVKSLLENSELKDSLNILIQGEESSFSKRRDIVEMLDFLRTKDLNSSANSNLESLIREKYGEPRFQKWLRNKPIEQYDLWFLVKEFLEQGGSESTIQDFIDYVHEESNNGNYLRVIARRQELEFGSMTRLVLSTIHKVKGIEFPAVILLDSNMQVRNPQEELRVLYVGMTRAEDVLMVLQGEREKNLLEIEPYEASHPQVQDYLVVEPSLRDVRLYFFGENSWRSNKIFQDVLDGDPVGIIREGQTYKICVDNNTHYIGKLASTENNGERLAGKLKRIFP